MDYLVKAIIFVPFMGVVYVFAEYFIGLLQDSISTLPFTSLFCQFGIYEGLSVFFTIIISSFVAKQAIDFVK